MATISTINATDDLETTSREAINTNFTNLNNDKVEGTLDTDDTLAADSDAKVPSQKAVKSYADTLAATKVGLSGDETIADRKAFTGTVTFSILPTIPTPPTADTHACSKKYADDLVITGGTDANTTTKGVVEEATLAEVIAATAAGGTLARLFVNPSTLSARGVVTIQSAAGNTLALTTVADEIVVVIAAGTVSAGGGTLNLAYNGVTKHSLTIANSGYASQFCAIYTETPGAATANVTLACAGRTVSEAVIIAIRIK